MIRDGHPPEYYLRERYRKSAGIGQLARAYYAIRPMMPRAVQLALRRLYARRQAKVSFPRWPVEPILVERANGEIKARIEESRAGMIPLINFWPGRYRAAVTLTHDVEGELGVANIGRVRELERRYGVVSAWNFVAERYPFDRRVLEGLKAEGCEIGLHGLYHDGKTFSSRKTFEERLPRMNAYFKEWGVVGFRSPATHRNADWMPEIAAAYDSSFPDTDPFEPQAGGCCSIFPFFLGDMVELPITLVQDHTLIEILREPRYPAMEGEGRLDHRAPRAGEHRGPSGLHDDRPEPAVLRGLSGVHHRARGTALVRAAEGRGSVVAGSGRVERDLPRRPGTGH